MLSALALMASTAIASAATVLSLDGFCNAYAMRKNGAGVYAALDTGCSEAIGGGVVATIKGSGKNAIIALQDPSNPGAQFEFTFSYPFVTGGVWDLYETTDGKHVSLILSGNYTVLMPAGAPPQKGPRSVTSK